MPGFDPYHVWLGIPPSRGEIDHYQLLGIQQYEADPEVIQDACERQSTPLRRISDGDRASLARSVLQRIERAKHVLVDQRERLSYEEALRERSTADAFSPTSDMHNRFSTEPTERRANAWVVWLIAVAVSCVSGFTVGGLVSGTGALFAEMSPESGPVAADDALIKPLKPSTVRLAAVKERVVQRGAKLKIACYATDPAGSRSALRFRFDGRPPANAYLDAKNGLFEWTPAAEWPLGIVPISITAIQTTTGATGTLRFYSRVEPSELAGAVVRPSEAKGRKATVEARLRPLAGEDSADVPKVDDDLPFAVRDLQVPVALPKNDLAVESAENEMAKRTGISNDIGTREASNTDERLASAPKIGNEAQVVINFRDGRMWKVLNSFRQRDKAIILSNNRVRLFSPNNKGQSHPRLAAQIPEQMVLARMVWNLRYRGKVDCDLASLYLAAGPVPDTSERHGLFTLFRRIHMLCFEGFNLPNKKFQMPADEYVLTVELGLDQTKRDGFAYNFFVDGALQQSMFCKFLPSWLGIDIFEADVEAELTYLSFRRIDEKSFTLNDSMPDDDLD